MKKKLKMEAEIQQKEYERAIQSRRSRKEETSHGKPSPTTGGKAPVNKVGTDNELTTPSRRRGKRTHRKAAPSFGEKTPKGKRWAPLANR